MGLEKKILDVPYELLERIIFDRQLDDEVRERKPIPYYWLVKKGIFYTYYKKSQFQKINGFHSVFYKCDNIETILLFSESAITEISRDAIYLAYIFSEDFDVFNDTFVFEESDYGKDRSFIYLDLKNGYYLTAAPFRFRDDYLEDLWEAMNDYRSAKNWVKSEV